MLADLSRNRGYDETIQRIIKGGEVVLDIGTGSGLLSMMCARAGAAKVYTCETISAIAEAAREVISENGFGEKIEVINKQSSSLKIGKELPAKADVLVSEVLDSGLLGEGVLPTVRHASAQLLKEGGRIIPAAATIKGMLIQSDHLHAIGPLQNISGFDLSSFGRFQVKEIYRRETLNNIPHTPLSRVIDLCNIDFYKLPPAVGPEAPNRDHIEVEIIADGMLHAVAFWFDLHLDDKLTLSSGPEGEMIHWGQAVYTLAPARQVKKGQRLDLCVEQSEMKVVFSLA
ncbi:MAG: 50S ribosomal protein L11 methyltransferase [Owenweeksia sp.]